MFTAEKRKAAIDLKSYLKSDQLPCSDESINTEPDPFENQVTSVQTKEIKAT
jgi:hypothetical protein